MRSQLQQQGWLCGYSEASPDASTAIADFLTDARQALPSGGAGAKLLATMLGMKKNEAASDVAAAPGPQDLVARGPGQVPAQELE